MITREDCIKVGEVTRTHNLDGAVVIVSDSGLLERYADRPVFLLLDGAPVPFFIAEEGLKQRNHSSWIVRFDDVCSQAQAERLLGCDVLLEKKGLGDGEVEDEEEDYDIGALIGFAVDDSSGLKGSVTDVADYSGNVVLTVRFDGREEVLVPLSDNFIRGLDPEGQVIATSIPRELLELNLPD